MGLHGSQPDPPAGLPSLPVPRRDESQRVSRRLGYLMIRKTLNRRHTHTHTHTNPRRGILVRLPMTPASLQGMQSPRNSVRFSAPLLGDVGREPAPCFVDWDPPLWNISAEMLADEPAARRRHGRVPAVIAVD